MASDKITPAKRPHRLVAQDGALSRPKQRFESAWGHTTSAEMADFEFVGPFTSIQET